MIHLTLLGAASRLSVHALHAAPSTISGSLFYAIQVAAYLALGLAFVSALARRPVTASRSIRFVWALLATVMLVLAAITAYQDIAGSASALPSSANTLTTPRPDVAIISLALSLAVLAYHTIAQLRRIRVAKSPAA